MHASNPASIALPPAKGDSMKSTRTTLCHIGLWVALCAAAAGPAPAQDGKTVTEEVFPSKKQAAAPGETNRYTIEIKISSPAAPGKVIKISEQFDSLTREAKPDATLTLVDTFTSGTVSFGAAPQDILKMLPVVTITRDRQGKFAAKAEGGSSEGNPEVMGVLQQFAATADSLFPDKPVHAGDKWKIAFTNVNTLVGGPKLTGEAELAATEPIQGENTSRIKFKIDEHAGDPQSQGEGVVNVDTHGRIVRLVQKGHGTFAGGPATVEIDIQRVEVKK
jgi:hypothetical protein